MYVPLLFNDLYSSPNIVREIKSRRMRWEGHVALMGERRGVCRALVGKPEGKRSLGRTRRQVAGTCECGDEPSGSIKCGEFLD
jgi:hypothetical protein